MTQRSLEAQAADPSTPPDQLDNLAATYPRVVAVNPNASAKTLGRLAQLHPHLIARNPNLAFEATQREGFSKRWDESALSCLAGEPVLLAGMRDAVFEVIRAYAKGAEETGSPIMPALGRKVGMRKAVRLVAGLLRNPNLSRAQLEELERLVASDEAAWGEWLDPDAIRAHVNADPSASFRQTTREVLVRTLAQDGAANIAGHLAGSSRLPPEVVKDLVEEAPRIAPYLPDVPDDVLYGAFWRSRNETRAQLLSRTDLSDELLIRITTRLIEDAERGDQEAITHLDRLLARSDLSYAVHTHLVEGLGGVEPDWTARPYDQNPVVAWGEDDPFASLHHDVRFDSIWLRNDVSSLVLLALGYRLHPFFATRLARFPNAAVRLALASTHGHLDEVRELLSLDGDRRVRAALDAETTPIIGERSD